MRNELTLCIERKIELCVKRDAVLSVGILKKNSEYRMVNRNVHFFVADKLSSRHSPPVLVILSK